jgi:bifunctional pyridoxal-dependent enzyme with beta-cystathionase and maltose regulon repressor activities
MRFGELACKHDLLILSDEIWSDIVYHPHAYTSIASLNKQVRDRTVTITGFSKSYGLAGLRIGAVMASDRGIFNQLLNASLHKSTVHGVSTLSQVAATTALNECGGWLSDFLRHLEEMRECCVDGLNNIRGVRCLLPEGCYVAFADITGTGMRSAEMQERLFNDARVAVVPGLPEWFGDGADGYIRLSFATSEPILSRALGRMKTTIESL